MKNVLHYVMIALTMVITACQFVQTQYPNQGALAIAISGLCTQLLLLFGVISGSNGSGAIGSSAAPALVPVKASPAPGVESAVAAATAAGAAALQASQPPVHS